MVTALLPVKRYRADYLRDAVGSLLAQTSPDWRALVIHERGSRSELESALGDAAADPRIRLVEERGRKLAGALNTGMREAETGFVAILFADDLWEPDAVEVLSRNIAERPAVDFFHSARRYVNDDGEPISGVLAPLAQVRADLFLQQGSVKHLLCWRRELGLAIGGIDESLDSVGPDDYDFPWSMAEAGAAFGAIGDCLYVYRDHRSCYRLTTHLPRRTHARGIRRILRKHGVPRGEIGRQLAIAREGYLRQCLYSSRLEAWLRGRLGREAAQVWREDYRR
jgi:glycosyltransferase involved in cell wall biosynthesis